MKLNCGDCEYFIVIWENEEPFRCFHPELSKGKYPVSSGEMRSGECGLEAKYFTKKKGTEDLMHQHFSVPSYPENEGT